MRGGWPEKWTFRSSDREEFIRQIRWFSSNYHKAYGRLLTPVVQGIRAKGPFAPSFADSIPRWVLIDGEGIGHAPDSTASVSTHYTSRYGSVDVILLVDNAKQPMLAAPISVLRSVATGGHQAKARNHLHAFRCCPWRQPSGIHRQARPGSRIRQERSQQPPRGHRGL